MSKFNPGDRVLVGGNFVATVHTYDEDNNRLVLVQQQNGGTNTIYGHISDYSLEPLSQVVAATSDDLLVPVPDDELDDE